MRPVGDVRDFATPLHRVPTSTSQSSSRRGSFVQRGLERAARSSSRRCRGCDCSNPAVMPPDHDSAAASPGRRRVGSSAPVVSWSAKWSLFQRAPDTATRATWLGAIPVGSPQSWGCRRCGERLASGRAGSSARQKSMNREQGHILAKCGRTLPSVEGWRAMIGRITFPCKDEPSAGA